MMEWLWIVEKSKIKHTHAHSRGKLSAVRLGIECRYLIQFIHVFLRISSIHRFLLYRIKNSQQLRVSACAHATEKENKKKQSSNRTEFYEAAFIRNSNHCVDMFGILLFATVWIFGIESLLIGRERKRERTESLEPEDTLHMTSICMMIFPRLSRVRLCEKNWPNYYFLIFIVFNESALESNGTAKRIQVQWFFSLFPIFFGVTMMRCSYCCWLWSFRA